MFVGNLYLFPNLVTEARQFGENYRKKNEADPRTCSRSKMRSTGLSGCCPPLHIAASDHSGTSAKGYLHG